MIYQHSQPEKNATTTTTWNCICKETQETGKNWQVTWISGMKMNEIKRVTDNLSAWVENKHLQVCLGLKTFFWLFKML